MAEESEEKELDDDAAAAAWYAAALVGNEYSDDEFDEGEDADVEEDDAGNGTTNSGTLEEDPYQAVSADDDPYLALTDHYGTIEGGLPEPARCEDSAQASVVNPPEKTSIDGKMADLAPAPWEAQRRRRRRESAVDASTSAPGATPALPVDEASQMHPPEEVMQEESEPPLKIPRTEMEVIVTPPERTPEPLDAPADEASVAVADNVDSANDEENEEIEDAVLADFSGRDEEVPDPLERSDADGQVLDADAPMPWDETVIVVRQGQIYIELQRCSPPLQDSMLLRFCDWLDEQLQVVVASFPYIRKSGANLDLSDNAIGPEGLDKLFRVLRQHRVPCVVIKAYRNVLDDSIIDTLIEYLYTQPEAFPMHGIHISHNSISDKGAFRLIRAAASCGHYPRFTSRLPLWLRLECNNVANPQKVVADCNENGFNVCLMSDGLCSRSDCNHYSGVHVQLPYFYNQGVRHRPQQNSALPDLSRDPEAQPDWMKSGHLHQGVVGAPAPKRVSKPAELLHLEAAVKAETQALAEAECVADTGKEHEEETNDAPPLLPRGLGMTTIARPPRPSSALPTQQPPRTQSHASWRPPNSTAGALAPRSPWSPQQQSKGKGNSGWNGDDRGGRGGWNTSGPSGQGKGGWQDKQAKGGKSWGGKGWDNGKGGGGGGGRGGGGGGKWGGKGGGKRELQMWHGVALVAKRKVEVKLVEADLELGFAWKVVGEGRPPQVLSVSPGSKVSESAQPGDSMLRLNGLDAAMFTEKQITDILRQRPLTLRFGDA